MIFKANKNYSFASMEIAIDQVATPTGTIMLSVLPLIFDTQFIVAAINIDINSTPKN